MAKESQSTRLVRSLEEFRGCSLQVTGRRAGFNGLSVCNGTVVRKIELKTVSNSDNWFAINGLYGIDSLFFDPQYYLYFVLPQEKIILIAEAVRFLQAQILGYNSEVGEDVREWIDLTRTLCTKSGLSIIPRINFKLRVGIRQLLKILELQQAHEEWQHCIDSVWRSQESGAWQRIFPAT